MPIGYSDGNMLAHLILKTPAGDLLLDHLRLAHNQMATERDLQDATVAMPDG